MNITVLRCHISERVTSEEIRREFHKKWDNVLTDVVLEDKKVPFIYKGFEQDRQIVGSTRAAFNAVGRVYLMGTCRTGPVHIDQWIARGWTRWTHTCPSVATIAMLDGTIVTAPVIEVGRATLKMGSSNLTEFKVDWAIVPPLHHISIAP